MQSDTRDITAVTDRIGHPAMIIDPMGTISWVNDPFLRIVGSSSDRILGQNAFEFLLAAAPEDAAAVTHAVECIALGQGFRIETACPGKDGGRVWLDIDCQPIFDRAGNTVGFLSICIDVTERCEDTEELQLQAERLRDAVEIAYDWYWESDREHRIVNLIVPPSYPFDEARVRGRYRWELAQDAHDREKWDAHRALLAARKPFRDFRYEVVYDDGVSRIVSTSGKPFFAADGRFLGYRGVARDVTEEARTAQNVDRFVRALREIEQRIFLFDREHRLIFVNNISEQIRNVVPMPIIGMHARDLFDHIDRAMFEAGIISSRGEHADMRWERFRNPGPPSEIAFMDNRTLLLQDYRLYDGGTLLLVSDITERKAYERELHQARRAAEAADKAKSAFLARMSHELRTPLNAIIGFAELMAAQDGRIDPSHVSDYANDIGTAGRRLHDIIGEILEYSSAENGELHIDPQPIAVRSLLAATLKGLRRWAKDNGRTIVCAAARDIPTIHADLDVSARALEILIQEVSTYDRLVNLRAYRDGQGACLEVATSGDCGAAWGDERGFELFQTANDPAVADAMGVGLALATARTLVLIQGGTIRSCMNAEHTYGYIVTFPYDISGR